MLRTYLLVCCFAVFAAGAWAAESDTIKVSEDRSKAQATDEMTQSDTNRVRSWRDLDRWSFQVGMAFITKSTIDEIASVDGEWGDGKTGGQIYLAQVSYKLAEWQPHIFKHRVEIDAELPFVLGVVDENGRDPFMQYNGGFALRWKTFPWNKWIYTNFEMGIGLTYSQRVLTAEREAHPTRERSHLEIYWPAQLMLALPKAREHQLAFFLHHHSGGTIFHTGGANSLGFGYRYVPAERNKISAE
jgi:hypothetical protein